MMNDLPLCRPEGLQTGVPTVGIVHVTEGLSEKQNTQNDRLGKKKNQHNYLRNQKTVRNEGSKHVSIIENNCINCNLNCHFD